MAEVATAAREYLEATRPVVDAALDSVLPGASAIPESLHAAMRHSVFAGGKRLRPMLALAGAEACGGAREVAMPFACAVELIHTYSLIHDDLPAFDDEALRRGQPTCHAVYGETIAILAGDALQALAFEVVSDAALTSGNPLDWTRAGRLLASASGSVGMCGGQTLDVEAAGHDLDLDGLRQLHALKTGALLTASVVGGGMVGTGDATAIRALTDYGDALGLAFQVVDDLLDVEGTAEELGKNPGGDAARDQPTFPSLIGVEASRAEAKALRDRAITALDSLPSENTEPLRGLADYVIARSH
ncbi:MAG: polyprenyl synthetase family protein [Acidobacteria bacterium]|nr:polyprenyl synthetase family protein [Acidobacteriota bacterium]